MVDAVNAWLNLYTPLSEVIARMTAAVVLGALLGWEREHEYKPAGLRTYALVSLGTASFMLMANDVQHLLGVDQSRYDPIRVIQGIVSGIGFLGAGTIIRSGGSVHGITTAAGIWVTAGIGAACGAGLYGIALFTTLFALLIVRVLKYAKPYAHAHHNGPGPNDSPRE